jgi:hypothetical protein
MRRLTSLLALLALAGCGPAPDSPNRLGLRGMLGYHVRANAATAIPASDIGFAVTANGQGGYRIAWAAFVGSASTFSGSVTSDGVFDLNQIAGLSGREQITVTTDGREIDFSSVPNDQPDGVDFVPSADPIYVDLLVDGGSGLVFFTGADTGRVLQSSYDPVAFTSP